MSNERSKAFDCTINVFDKSLNRDLKIEEVERCFKIISTFYCIILHDEDINDNGELKNPHYHIYFTTECTIGKQRAIKTIMLALKLKSCDNIHVLPSLNATLSMRYLCHLDDEDKHPYELNKVVSNDYPKFYNTVSNTYILNEDTLLELAFKCNNLFEFIKTVGMSSYEKHWRLYERIFEHSQKIKRDF